MLAQVKASQPNRKTVEHHGPPCSISLGLYQPSEQAHGHDVDEMAASLLRTGGAPAVAAESLPCMSTSQHRRPNQPADVFPTPFAEVIWKCNKFRGDIRELWAVYICNHPRPIGYMRDEFRRNLNWSETSFRFLEDRDRKVRSVSLMPEVGDGDDVVESCRCELVELCEKNRQDKGCDKWLRRPESQRDYHPVRGMCGPLQGLKVPSPLRGIIGMVTSGTHMNMYTVKTLGGKDKAFIWIARRSKNVTYAGKLDQLVAGAMSPEDGMDPLATLRREGEEEAGLVFDRGTFLMREGSGKFVGRVSRGSQITFYDRKDHIAGTEAGHLEPGIRFTFDLRVGEDYIPKPTEPESIEGFYLKSVEEVKRDLCNAEWKPNCGLVMLDFLLRRKLIEEVDESAVAALRAGLERPLFLDPHPQFHMAQS